jgi:nitroreductase
LSKESFLKTIFARRSIREYTSDPVEEQDVRLLLEAAMAAPSASNRKPWHFIVVTRREALQHLAKVHPYGSMLAGAALCIAVCGDPHISPKYWVQDCSAATENLLLAASALDLGAVWLGVHPRTDRLRSIREALRVPEEIVPLNLISIGHPAEGKEPRTQYDEARIHREQW